MELIERKAYFFDLFCEHILISFGALTITMILGIALGIWVFYAGRSGRVVLPIVNFLYTIPSIAMFGLLIPLVGIGLKNAIIVLVLYGLLPMVRNTYTGLKEVREDVVEAAKAMGASRFHLFKDVYFPLALPSIVSALRVTTVMLVALTGLAALIGAGGLGQAIFRGLNTMNDGLILTGSLGISILAIASDQFIGSFEERLVRVVSRNATKKQKLRIYGNMTLLFGLLFLAAFHVWPSSNSSENSIVVASKPTSEQYILGEILSQMIEKETDIKVIRKFGIGGGTTNIHPAILNGEVDMYVEYTGTAWMSVLKQSLPSDNIINIEVFQQMYQDQFQLSFLGLLGFNNTFGLAIPDHLAEKYQIVTCSDLTNYSHLFRFGAEFDFFERSDGYQGLIETYNLQFSSIHEMDINLRYNAIVQGKVNVIDAFTTDAKIVAQNLRVLIDDKNYFPSYEAGIVMRNQTLDEHPELASILRKLNNQISTKKMMQMNYQVEVEGEDPKKVAQTFITKIKTK